MLPALTYPADADRIRPPGRGARSRGTRRQAVIVTRHDRRRRRRVRKTSAWRSSGEALAASG